MYIPFLFVSIVVREIFQDTKGSRFPFNSPVFPIRNNSFNFGVPCIIFLISSSVRVLFEFVSATPARKSPLALNDGTYGPFLSSNFCNSFNMFFTSDGGDRILLLMSFLFISFTISQNSLNFFFCFSSSVGAVGSVDLLSFCCVLRASLICTFSFFLPSLLFL